MGTETDGSEVFKTASTEAVENDQEMKKPNIALRTSQEKVRTMTGSLNKPTDSLLFKKREEQTEDS